MTTDVTPEVALTGGNSGDTWPSLPVIVVAVWEAASDPVVARKVDNWPSVPVMITGETEPTVVLGGG